MSEPNKQMQRVTKCLSRFDCRVSEFCGEDGVCRATSREGDPCRRFVKARTCPDGLECDAKLSKCLAPRPVSFLERLGTSLPWPSSQAPPSQTPTITPEIIERGPTAGNSCSQQKDCAVEEFCGISTNANPSRDCGGDWSASYLDVTLVENAPSNGTLTKEGTCMRRQPLDHYCTSNEMCQDGLGCDLDISKKCRIKCFSDQDCSFSVLQARGLFPTPPLPNVSWTNGQCFGQTIPVRQGFCIGYEQHPVSSSSSTFHENNSDHCPFQLSFPSPLSILTMTLVGVAFWAIACMYKGKKRNHPTPDPFQTTRRDYPGTPDMATTTNPWDLPQRDSYS